MTGGKARAVMKNEAYFLYAVVTHDKRNTANGYFSTASQEFSKNATFARVKKYTHISMGSST